MNKQINKNRYIYIYIHTHLHTYFGGAYRVPMPGPNPVQGASGTGLGEGPAQRAVGACKVHTAVELVHLVGLCLRVGVCLLLFMSYSS